MKCDNKAQNMNKYVANATLLFQLLSAATIDCLKRNWKRNSNNAYRCSNSNVKMYIVNYQVNMDLHQLVKDCLRYQRGHKMLP